MTSLPPYTSFITKGKIDGSTCYYDKYILNYASWGIRIKSITLSNVKKNINIPIIVRSKNITGIERKLDVIEHNPLPLEVLFLGAKPTTGETITKYISNPTIHRLTCASDQIIFEIVPLLTTTASELDNIDLSVHAELIRL